MGDTYKGSRPSWLLLQSHSITPFPSTRLSSPPSCRSTSHPHHPPVVAPTHSASHRTRIKRPHIRDTTPFPRPTTALLASRAVQPTTSPPQFLGEAAVTADPVAVTLTTVRAAIITVTAVPTVLPPGITVRALMYAFRYIHPYISHIY
jgi:hypothetical protein